MFIRGATLIRTNCHTIPPTGAFMKVVEENMNTTATRSSQPAPQIGGIVEVFSFAPDNGDSQNYIRLASLFTQLDFTVEWGYMVGTREHPDPQFVPRQIGETTAPNAMRATRNYFA